MTQHGLQGKKGGGGAVHALTAYPFGLKGR